MFIFVFISFFVFDSFVSFPFAFHCLTSHCIRHSGADKLMAAGSSGIILCLIMKWSRDPINVLGNASNAAVPLVSGCYNVAHPRYKPTPERAVSEKTLNGIPL